MSEFIKNFFRDNTAESSARLCLIAATATVITLCVVTEMMFFVTGKDFSNQCAVLSGILLTIPSLLKGFQKTKESVNNDGELKGK